MFCWIFRDVGAAMRHIVAVLLLASSGAASEDHSRPYCRENSSCVSNKENILHIYKVRGIKVIAKHEGTLFYLRCFSQSMSVDDPELPVMKQLQEVETVKVSGCSSPLNTSYADSLKAMNFTVNRSLILNELPADPRLNHQHLSGLPIYELEIYVKGDPQRPTHNYLDGLLGLRSLKLHNVIPEPEALIRLPNTLESLELKNAQLPTAESKTGNGSAWLERLSSLRYLDLVEGDATGKLTVPALKSLPYLTNLSLTYITLDSSTLAGKLKKSSLKHLVMRSCGLIKLPDKLFKGANLTTLDLSLNNLTVQEGVFSPLRWLTELNLEESQVDPADLVNIVSFLPQLEILKANNNPLGSLCDDTDTFSKLTWPKSLRYLNLSKTNVTRICPDWIDNDALLDINLSHNDIRFLNYNDLMMKRAVLNATAEVTIDLTNNPNLRIINISSADIKQCRTQLTSSLASNNRTRAKIILKLDNLRDDQCDYGAFLLHEIVQNCPWLQLNKDFFTELLSPSIPDEILCPYDGSSLPGCSYKMRPRDNATVVRCAGALPRAPRWPLPSHEYPLALYAEPRTLDNVPRLFLVELHAPYNNITELNEDDIPDSLLVLDVRYNTISHISEAVARKLSAIGTNRSVYLEGNKLTCSCSDAPALYLLKHVVLDLNKTQCADDIDVFQKIQTLSDLCAFSLLPINLSLSIVLVLLMVGLLLHRFKPQIRQILFKLNWGRRFIFRVKDDDAEKTVNVFLSYSHHDLEVLNELKNGLEARGYSTLEHNRDWQPSVPILDQIVHSVESAHRTLLLVSDNYADSPWAVEEFRAAHVHAMKRQTARVLVVRYNLCQPERLPPDLQLYIKYNTYLDRHDVNFWEKLCMAMPKI